MSALGPLTLVTDEKRALAFSPCSSGNDSYAALVLASDFSAKYSQQAQYYYRDRQGQVSALLLPFLYSWSCNSLYISLGEEEEEEDAPSNGRDPEFLTAFSWLPGNIW